MVKIVTRTLADQHAKRSQLITAVNQKITLNQITTVNQDIFNKLKVDGQQLQRLLEVVEERIRKCEIASAMYFDTIEHSVLGGTPFSDSFLQITSKFTYPADVLEINLKMTDPNGYREMIDTNFQTVILTVAAILENLVRLNEILVKKIILHVTSKPPLSAPFDSYVDYLDNLVKLGYRTTDPFYICINGHRTFCQKYLLTINQLRNRYIHGFNSALGMNSGYYAIVDSFDKNSFSSTSPDLIVDVFVKNIVTSVKDITESLLDHLIIACKTPHVTIPV